MDRLTYFRIYADADGESHMQKLISRSFLSRFSLADRYPGRGRVLDLFMRDADILQVAATQVVQGGSHLFAFAPFLKRIPASPDEARDFSVRRGRLSQYRGVRFRRRELRAPSRPHQRIARAVTAAQSARLRVGSGPSCPLPDRSVGRLRRAPSCRPGRMTSRSSR